MPFALSAGVSFEIVAICRLQKGQCKPRYSPTSTGFSPRKSSIATLPSRVIASSTTLGALSPIEVGHGTVRHGNPLPRADDPTANCWSSSLHSINCNGCEQSPLGRLTKPAPRLHRQAGVGGSIVGPLSAACCDYLGLRALRTITESRSSGAAAVCFTALGYRRSSDGRMSMA